MHKTSLISLLSAAVIMLAACQDISDGIAKAEKPLPPDIVRTIKAKGMARTSPILVRIFKEEGVFEVWKQKDNGRYDIVKTYEICKWSGKLGPKFVEGDRQAPEGFYTVRPHQMNPQSKYHLAFNIGFPNSFDRVHGRSGQHLMVHGACSSAGCYSMTDEQVEEIYAFGRDAFEGGQREFQIQAFPFRMTAANMARYTQDSNYDFWVNLKEGYDHFEITKVPPKVDVCEKRYVFNQVAPEGYEFSPSGACPPTSQPELLASAYADYQQKFTVAFDQAISETGYAAPSPTIRGLEEAKLVAEWSKRRARGEKVSPEPPNLDEPAPLTVIAPQSKPQETENLAAATAKPDDEETAETETAGASEPVVTPTENTAPSKNRWWNPFD